MNKAEMETLLITEAKRLPPDKLAEVIDFAAFLNTQQKNKIVKTRPNPMSLRGIWRNIPLTEQNITEARAEMWGNFPRGDI